MSFWTSPTGSAITGEPEKAFIKDFTTIPEGTKAIASIKNVEVINKEATNYAKASKFIQIIYKLVDGDYRNREVSQKIKCFDGTPEQVERNLNMLMLVMKLCDFKPNHNNEPTAQELSTMCGKVVGIKIGEWSMPKNDGPGNMEGNFVREVSPSAGFVCETGVKSEVVHTRSHVESAFDRNPRGAALADLDQDLPF